MKKIFSLILLVMSIIIFAQTTYNIQGIVKDFHDKSPLKNAKVVVGSSSVVTDAKGKFQLSNLPKGTYSIIANHPDCDPYENKVEVDKNLYLEIVLEHHSNEIVGVTLHATHKQKGSIIVKTLDKSTIDQNSTENLGNLLTRISGVTSLKTGNNISKPVIHGLYGSRVSIINNGTKMAEQEWGVEHAPNVDVNNFEHIDVIKGSSALKYGNESVGGVVVLEPQILPKKDTLMGNVKLSGISNGRGGELSADVAKTWENQWFVKTGGSYKKLGDLYTPHHTLQNTGAEINSFNFSFGNRSFNQGFDVSYSGIQQEFGIYKGAHLGSPEDFYKAINLGQNYFQDNFSYNIDNPKQEVNHHIVKLAAYKRFADLGKFSFQYSFQLNSRKEYDIRRGELKNLPSMDLRLITHSASITHLLERQNWSLESGISANVQDNFPDPRTKARRLIPDYYRYDVGAFSVFKYSFNSKLKAEAGVRYDFNRYDAYKYYDASSWKTYAQQYPQFFVSEADSRVLTRPILDYHNFSANVGLNYTPNDHLDFKLNLSKADRAPNPAELFSDGLHHSAAVMEEGNLSINKEQIYSATLSMATKLDVLKGLHIDVNPYIMYSENFINQVPTGVVTTNRGVFPIWSFQQIKARIMGIDADASLNVTDHLSWNGNFSILKGDDLTNNEPLILMMPASFRNSIELKLNRPNNFYVRLENENVFKQNRYPIRNMNIDFIENGTTVTREIDYSSTPAAFSIFHASVGLNVTKAFNLNFRINNIFNTEYREYLNRLRYFMAEPGRNVVITAKLNF
ncbi:TonB-dependent receptor [Chryseobacterium sp. T1]